MSDLANAAERGAVKLGAAIGQRRRRDLRPARQPAAP